METINRERIKDRMLKTTARLWGIPENEIETSFDPLLLLMIDACASELEKIGYNISASQSRLLDRLADLVLPEALLGPTPASSVMHATPLDSIAKVLPTSQFYINQKLQRPQGGTYTTDVYFTPIGEFPIHKAQLRHMLVGNKLYNISEQASKTLAHVSEGKESTTIQEIWLAISTDKALDSLEGLSIYFDMRSHSEATSFYKSLENATGFAGEKNVELAAGYHRSEQFELSAQEMLETGHSYTRKINQRIAAIYQRQFVHLASRQKLSDYTTELPGTWKTQLPDKILGQLVDESLLYLKIDLNRPFSAGALDGLACSINCFPIINRKYNTLNYRTDAWVNIIPLNIEGSYLDLDDITGSSGGKFKFRSASQKHALEEGEASIRSSGIGKSDSREVREMIGSLTEAIRDESAYFSELSNEFLLARLREVSQILARLEDQLSAARDNRAPHHYVLLRPKVTGDQVTINYWTTNAEDANNVKAGSPLTPHNHSQINSKSALTITNAFGGKSGIDDSEKKLLLKQQLVSKGKIVSAEDIRLLCFHIFGEKLKQAEVKKGVQIGSAKADGFIRTIDVHLSLTPEVKERQEEEVRYLCSSLEHYLKQNAPPNVPFRIIMN